jgi:hypothetical protein
MIPDIDGERTLGRHEMTTVSGGTGAPGLSGNSWLNDLGPVANVNIGISQNISQAQFINVETLNNSIVGPGVKLPNINVSPKLWAETNAAV